MIVDVEISRCIESDYVVRINIVVELELETCKNEYCYLTMAPKGSLSRKDTGRRRHQ